MNDLKKVKYTLIGARLFRYTSPLFILLLLIKSFYIDPYQLGFICIAITGALGLVAKKVYNLIMSKLFKSLINVDIISEESKKDFSRLQNSLSAIHLDYFWRLKSESRVSEWLSLEEVNRGNKLKEAIRELIGKKVEIKKSDD